MLTVHLVPAFEDNYIWLPGIPGNAEVAIVDPGDAEPVIELVEKEKLKPEAILITHHHRDHTGGVAELAKRYGVPVFGPADSRIPEVTDPVIEGSMVKLSNGLCFTVLFTPGHTRSHVCFKGHGALFCGDTLFTGGCGRLFEGTPAEMEDSLRRLSALPDETTVYCAHEYTLDNLSFALVAEPNNAELIERRRHAQSLRDRGQPTVPSTLALEKQTNPFLRSDSPQLKEAAERFAGRRLNTRVEVFTVVRQWKDSLD